MISKHFFTLISCCFICAIATTIIKKNDVTDWIAAEPFLTKFVFPHRDNLITVVDNLLSESHLNISSSCLSSLSSFRDGLVTGDPHSFTLMDSFGKFKPGFYGSHKVIDFGHYDQCLNAKGRYVLLQVHYPLDKSKSSWSNTRNSTIWIEDMRLSLRTMYYFTQSMIAVCFPPGCSTQDVENVVLASQTARMLHPLHLEIEAIESDEDSHDPFFDDYKNIRIFSMFFIACLICLTVIATIFPSNLLKNFNAKKNTQSLFRPSSDPRLDPFNGWKFLYLLVGLAGHFLMPINIGSGPFMMEITRHAMSIPNAEISTKIGFIMVPLNFVVSACLSVTSRYPEIVSKKGSINWFNYTLLRMLRTRPVTIVVVLIAFCFPLLSHRGGPRMNVIQRNLTSICYQNGWREILFHGYSQGNFIFVCSPPSWFAATDLCFYMASFVTLILLFRKSNWAMVLMFSQVATGVLYTAYVIWREEISPAVVIFFTSDMERVRTSLFNLYIQWYVNLPCYTVGIFLGYLISSRCELPRKWRQTAWFICSLSFMFFLFIPVLTFDHNVDFLGPRWLEVLIGSTHRVLCAIPFAGLLYLSWLEPNSLLSNILSARIWTLSARLSFSIFMTHPYLIAFMMGMQREMFFLTQWSIFEKLLFLFIVSHIIGYLTYICVEAPFDNIFKGWLSTKPKRKEEEKNGVLTTVARVEKCKKV